MAPKEFNFHIYNTTFFGQCWEAKNTKAIKLIRSEANGPLDPVETIYIKVTTTNIKELNFIKKDFFTKIQG